MGIKENRFVMREEEFINIVNSSRNVIYNEANQLEEVIKAYLGQEASRKITKEIYFVPCRGEGRTRKVRVVRFNHPLHILDPNGTISKPYVIVREIAEMPADRSAKKPREWVLLETWGQEVALNDLATDDLFYLTERMIDVDCSLQPEWTPKDQEEEDSR